MPPDASPSPAEPDDVLWFYKTRQGTLGPLRRGELLEKLSAAVIPAETPVWHRGLAAWIPANACGELTQSAARIGAMPGLPAGWRPRGPRAAFIAGALALATLLVAGVLAGLPWTTAVAHVTGRVTVEGEPVSDGTVILSPIGSDADEAPGRPGIAAIGAGGGFALRIEPGTRGLAKRCVVRFVPPVLPPMSEAEAMEAVPPYFGFLPKTQEVEIHAGENRIDIEIAPPGSGERADPPR